MLNKKMIRQKQYGQWQSLLLIKNENMYIYVMQGYRLVKGDIIKIGRILLRVKELVNDEYI